MLDWLSAALLPVQRFMDAGGFVLWWIFIAAVALWTLILERYWYFHRVWPRRRDQVCEHWRSRDERRSWTARRVRAALISAQESSMAATLPLIQMMISMCPLLGLLGTVTGMIEVFDVMALKGTSDARAMAAGVSRATIPTMAGMVVGLSGLLSINRFRKRVKVETERLGDELAYT
ncbi:MotA/TolQ/ExbB proton channel family protein [Sinimarinibacterium thermocellulolyticum]|uniref:MotA/TolQ/ExbB proton channel family protein n=1 Tax=Sinimarinibacterium thermocellulolyticum TaxID=3170016 RepID=A0ABV2ABI3_9GAMM